MDNFSDGRSSMSPPDLCYLGAGELRGEVDPGGVAGAVYNDSHCPSKEIVFPTSRVSFLWDATYCTWGVGQHIGGVDTRW